MSHHHSALLYTMVMVAAADAQMTDPELDKISELVRYLPVFRDFDVHRMPEVTRECSALLQHEDGLDDALDLIRDQLPDGLRETAYAVACDVAAANGKVGQEVLRLLELLRHRLELDDLVAAAIERGARARHRVA